jgi:hypothetical protein
MMPDMKAVKRSPEVGEKMIKVPYQFHPQDRTYSDR